MMPFVHLAEKIHLQEMELQGQKKKLMSQTALSPSSVVWPKIVNPSSIRSPQAVRWIACPYLTLCCGKKHKKFSA
uniref:Uncharacterized protein n=1 Tax=Anguilla anguilla TaxID=7936 RepID=A0A0E9RSP2_ANGAN